MEITGGTVMMRVRKPDMMKTEHPISTTIITVIDSSGLMPSTEGNVWHISAKQPSCLIPNCISMMPTKSRRKSRPRLV